MQVRCTAPDNTRLASPGSGHDDAAASSWGSAAMEFGSFMEFPPVASGTESAAFDQALAEVETAERVGLDAIWLAELHGAPERSVMSAPIMVATAIAAPTAPIQTRIPVHVFPRS